MDRKDPVGAIRRRSDYGSGDEDGPEFVQCVDGRDLHIHEVWTFGEEGVTREVHPTAQVDVGAGFVGELATNYLTPSWPRIPMFGLNSIYGNVQWLGVPDPLRTNGPPWNDNILAPIPDWGTGGTTTNPNWGSQPGGTYGSVAGPWSGPVCAIPDYFRRSPENTRIAAHRVRDNLLRENYMVRMQSLSTSCSILRDCLVNRWDCECDDLWDEPNDQ